MKYVLQVCFAVVFATSGARCVQGADVTPASLEVNLGSIALDYYDGCITNSEFNLGCTFADWVNGAAWPQNMSGSGSLGTSDLWVFHDPNCSQGTVYRQCIQQELAAYAAQGVVGVRFQFGMNGCCSGSTPFLDAATYKEPKAGAQNPGWMNNLLLFFQDLRAANIQYVSFTPDMDGGLGGSNEAIWYCLSGGSWSSCPSGHGSGPPGTGTPDIVYYPWLPWGSRAPADATPYDPTVVTNPTEAYHPFSDPTGYDTDPYLPQGAWGWAADSPFVSFLDAILLRAQQAQLTVREVDLRPETAISLYPVTGRLIYDNTTNTPVLDVLGQPRRANGYTSAPVILSSPAASIVSGVNYSTCTTDYPEYSSSKDSALVIDASEILALETGYWFGVPEGSSYPANNLDQCNVVVQGGAAAHAPVPTNWTAPPPVPQDIHNYPCQFNSQFICDPTISTQSAAQTIYASMAQFIANNSLGSSTFIVGETDSSSTLASGVPTFSTTSALEDGAGFQASGLASSNVVLRPWESVDFTPPPPQVFQLNTPAALSGNSGLPFNVGACTYDPLPTPIYLGYQASSAPVPVTNVQGSCWWIAAPASPANSSATVPSPPIQSPPTFSWITPQSTPVWQQGSGWADFDFTTNSSTARRTFQVTIAGQTVTFNQEGSPAPPTAVSPVGNLSYMPTTLMWSWGTNSSWETYVYLGTPSGSQCVQFSPIGTVSGNATSVSYGPFSLNTAYCWYVVALDEYSNPYQSQPVSFTTPARMPGSRVGLVRQNVFDFDSNGNEVGPAPVDPADRVDAFAPPGGVLAGDQPVVGDWTGDGHAKAGWFRPSTGQWWLDAANSGVYSAGGSYTYQFAGGPNDVAIIGDWAGLGKAAIGVVRSGFLWILDINADGIFEAPAGTPTVGDAVFAFGASGDVPVTGNWSGKTSAAGFAQFQAGMVRTYCNPNCTGGPFVWLLDSGIAGTVTGGVGSPGTLSGGVTGNHGVGNLPGTAFGGAVGDIPVTGDWNNIGLWQFGDFGSGLLWVLDGATPLTAQAGHVLCLDFAYGGLTGDKPIVGKW